MHITTILWYESAHSGIQIETHLFTYPVCQRVQSLTALLQCCHCSFCNADIWGGNNEMAPSGTSSRSFAELPCESLLANAGRAWAPTVGWKREQDVCRGVSRWEAGMQFLTARHGVHVQYGVSTPASACTSLIREG